MLHAPNKRESAVKVATEQHVSPWTSAGHAVEAAAWDGEKSITEVVDVDEFESSPATGAPPTTTELTTPLDPPVDRVKLHDHFLTPDERDEEQRRRCRQEHDITGANLTDFSPLIISSSLNMNSTQPCVVNLTRRQANKRRGSDCANNCLKTEVNNIFVGEKAVEPATASSIPPSLRKK